MLSKNIKFFARLYGVERKHQDLWGNKHQATLEQMKDILLTMGVGTDDLERSQDFALSWRREHYRRVLPPVLVRYEGQEHRFLGYLPAGKWSANWRLVLQEEGGNERSWDLNRDGVKFVGTTNVGAESFNKAYFTLPGDIAPGYHRVVLCCDEQESYSMTLIIAPHRCYLPETNGEQKRGVNVQLYSLRSPGNWGFGQFSDLNYVADYVARQQGAFVGLNPIHAVSLQNLDYTSPYSPVSRSWLNALYLDLDEIACLEQGKKWADDFAAKYSVAKKKLRELFLIDYAQVRKVKLAAARELYEEFAATHLRRNTDLAEQFRAFREHGNESLQRYACYEALAEDFIARDRELRGWQQWPEDYRDYNSPAVLEFRQNNPKKIEFYSYLQWHADRQLQAVVANNRAKGLGIGLYIDLALSSEKGGADVWQQKEYYAISASVGCPPDQYAPDGQNWSFPPLIPHRLRAAAYAPFIEVLQRNFKYSGALRIDHAMSLSRLFWIPPSGKAANGLYVRYPLRDLMAILALESQRNQCIIVGEDLGTVPVGFRELMAEHNMLAYKVFFFMRTWDGGFQDLSAYHRLSLVTSTTHDLYTLRGYWDGEDLRLRVKLGHIADEKYEDELAARENEKRKLLDLLIAAEMLPADLDLEVTLKTIDENVVEALIAFLKKSSCYLLTIPIEDIVGQVKQVNMPGVTDGYDSWKHRLPRDVAELG